MADFFLSRLALCRQLRRTPLGRLVSTQEGAMHRLVLSSRRTVLAVVVVVAAAAVVSGATLARTATAAAAPHHNPQCSTATLNGTYLFAGDGFSISGSSQTPLAFAGSERFDGAGRVAGTNSFSSGGTIARQAPFTGTYTLAADCTGTLTIGTSLHFDVYASPRGDQFVYVQTDPGSVSATTEHRATRE